MENTTCTCGQSLNDSSDRAEYKARFVSDTDSEAWDSALDLPRLAQGGDDRGLSLERDVYQCHQCGRIWLETQKGSS